MDKSKTYWVWQNGVQVCIYYDTYTNTWSAVKNNSGKM